MKDIKLPQKVEECKQESAKQIVNEYIDVFSGIGKVPGAVTLKLEPYYTPVVHPPRPVPVALREKVKHKLDELCNLDIIEKIPMGIPSAQTQW